MLSKGTPSHTQANCMMFRLDPDDFMLEAVCLREAESA